MAWDQSADLTPGMRDKVDGDQSADLTPGMRDKVDGDQSPDLGVLTG